MKIDAQKSFHYHFLLQWRLIFAVLAFVCSFSDVLQAATWQLYLYGDSNSEACTRLDSDVNEVLAGMLLSNTSEAQDDGSVFFATSAVHTKVYSTKSIRCGVVKGMGQTFAVDAKDFRYVLQNDLLIIKLRSLSAQKYLSSVNLDLKDLADNSVELNEALDFQAINNSRHPGQVSAIQSTRFSFVGGNVAEVSIINGANEILAGSVLTSQSGDSVGIVGSEFLNLNEGRPVKKCILLRHLECLDGLRLYSLIPTNAIVEAIRKNTSIPQVAIYPLADPNQALYLEVPGALFRDIVSVSGESAAVEIVELRNDIGRLPEQSYLREDMEALFSKSSTGIVNSAVCIDGIVPIKNVKDILSASAKSCRLHLKLPSEVNVERSRLLSSAESLGKALAFNNRKTQSQAKILKVWAALDRSLKLSLFEKMSFVERKILFELLDTKSESKELADEFYAMMTPTLQTYAKAWESLPTVEQRLKSWVSMSVSQRMLVFQGISSDALLDEAAQLDSRFPRYAEDQIREYMYLSSAQMFPVDALGSKWVTLGSMSLTKNVTQATLNDLSLQGLDLLRFELPTNCSMGNISLQVGDAKQDHVPITLQPLLIEKLLGQTNIYFRIPESSRLNGGIQFFANSKVPGLECKILLTRSDSRLKTSEPISMNALYFSDAEIVPHQSFRKVLSINELDSMSNAKALEFFDALYGFIHSDLNYWVSQTRSISRR
ncbi:MAG: hypothetical protein NT027_08450 [Proteobacteria bacterium]|nr:hypothetical protein [Pseudomonadota bacterium]